VGQVLVPGRQQTAGDERGAQVLDATERPWLIEHLVGERPGHVG
jgi:hypothetical protein